MKLLFAALLTLSTGAYAQSMPVPMYNGNCPTGSYSSGGACVPKRGKIIFWNNGNSNCPSGYYSSSGYCVGSIN
jgi:hypothetical protein